MANLGNFDATKVEPAQAPKPVPSGEYVAQVVKSELKPTKAGNGRYLELSIQIMDGPYKGRMLWDRLNIDNPNETAVLIAQQQLSALCHAVGVMQPRDSVQLHNLPFMVRVALVKRADTGEPTNEVKGYKKRESAKPAEAPEVDGEETAPWGGGE